MSSVVFVSEIVKVLINDEVLVRERTRFVGCLGTPVAENKKWEALYVMDISTSFEHFTKLIDEWVQRTTPTLGRLREILKTCGFRAAIGSLASLGDNNTIIKINQSSTSSPVIVIFFKVTPPSSYFVGRGAEVKELYNLFRSKSPPVVVISGMGGQGKTQLCRQFIKTLKNQGPQSTPAVTWLGGDNSVNLTSSVIQLAEYLKIPTTIQEKPIPFEELLSQVADNLSTKSSNGWLVVIDNVDETYPEFQKTVPALINGTAFVLVTARKIDILSGEAKQIKLCVLRQEDAEELVIKCMYQRPSDQEIKDMCHDLGNHALALRQALAYINAQQNENCSSYGIQEYLRQLAKDRMLLQNQVFIDDYDQTIYLIVTRTMKTILEQHADEGMKAAELMEVLCLVRPDGISKECLQKFVNIVKTAESKPDMNDDEMHKALLLLKKYSMISYDKGTISIHRLVQKFAKSEESNAVNMLLKGIDIDDSSKEELQQILSIWEHADPGTVKEHVGLPLDMFKMMGLLGMMGQKTFAEKNHKLLTGVLGPYNENTMFLNHAIGAALLYNGDYEGSLPIFTELLNKARRTFGETNKLVLQTETSICHCLQYLNRPQEALERYKRLLELQINVLGPNHKLTITTRDDLARVLTSMGMDEEGFQIHKQILRWRKENLSENHPLTMVSRSTLGEYYLKNGMFKEARSEFEAVIKGFTSSAKESQLAVGVKYFLSISLWGLGEGEKAIRVLEEAIQVPEIAYGPKQTTVKKIKDLLSSLRTGVIPKKFKRKTDQGHEARTPTGKGYVLDDTATAAAGQPTSQDAVVRICYWSNGFTLDEGPLRSYTDASDLKFLKSIDRNEVPVELRKKVEGRDCILSIIHNRSEAYTPQRFTGLGQTSSNQTTSTSGEQSRKINVTAKAVETFKVLPQLAWLFFCIGAQATPQSSCKALENIALKSDSPTTSIQFRLMDGSWLGAQFNHSHTVQDLHNFINTARPEYSNTNYVLTLFPNIQLTNKEQGLKDANTLNSTLVQKRQP